MTIAVKTIKAKGKIKNGHLIIEEGAGLFPQDGEVEVVITLKVDTSENIGVKDPAWDAYLSSEAEREAVYTRLADA